MMIKKQNRDKKQPSNQKDILMIGIGFIFSALIVWFLLKNIDLRLVWQNIQDISPFILLIALFAIAFSTLFRAQAWKVILNNRINFFRSYKSVNEGMMLNIILPLRMGDLARALFTSNTTHLPVFDLIATIIVERIFDVFIMLLLLLLSIPFMLVDTTLMNTVLLSILLIIIVIVGICIVIFLPRQLKQMWHFIFKRFSSLDQWGSDKIEEISNSLQILRDPKMVIKIIFWMILTWLCALGSIWILLLEFFPDISILMPIFLQGVSGLGVSVPSSPGSIGVYEATMVFGLRMFNVQESAAFAFGLVHHVISIIPVLLIGWVSLVLDGQNFSGWFVKLQKLRQEK